jgi:hypothetical protein
MKVAHTRPGVSPPFLCGQWIHSAAKEKSLETTSGRESLAPDHSQCKNGVNIESGRPICLNDPPLAQWSRERKIDLTSLQGSKRPVKTSHHNNSRPHRVASASTINPNVDDHHQE